MIIPLASSATTDVLSITLRSNELIDFLRVMVAFLGLVHLLVSMHRMLSHQVFLLGFALGGTGLFTMLQELEQVGQPFTPWRLPLLAVMNASGIVFMYRLGVHGHERNAYDSK